MAQKNSSSNSPRAPKKRSKTPSKRARKKENSSFKTLLKWAFVASIWSGIILTCVLAWYGRDLPKIAKRVADETDRIVTIYASDGTTELAAYGHLKGPNINVKNLPDHIPNAFIAIEDRRFHRHFGIDFIGLARAFFMNAKAGGVVQGGSTITQQLAKNLYFKPERTLERKIQEAMLSLWIEYKYTKPEILSAYLNHVYFGAGAYGLNSAAHIYFNKSPEQLNVKEAALLAGLMQAPSRLSPLSNPEAAIKRMKIVLNAMEESGYINEKMIKEAQSIRIVDGKISGMDLASRTKDANYFTDWIYRQVNVYADDTDEDLRVVTTLSAPLQKQVSAFAKAEIDKAYKPEKGKKHPEVAAVLLDKNGAIRAMVGGYDYQQSQFNRATDGQRQAGSSFKPFIYLAGIEQGMTPETLISNEAITSGRYRPSNYDGRYSESATLREALALSYNVSAVYMLKEVGTVRVKDLAMRVGIDAEVREELSTALGTVDMSLLDLVGAYATIGQKGVFTNPFGILKIETKSGKLIYKYQDKSPTQAIARSDANAITAMMQDVVMYGTGQRAQTGFPIAGKTGTTQDYRDAVFIGFSSVYTMGVWTGNDDNSSLGRGSYGGGVPAGIWRQSMIAAHQGVAAGPVTNYSAGSLTFDNLIGGLFESNTPESQPTSDKTIIRREERFEFNQ